MGYEAQLLLGSTGGGGIKGTEKSLPSSRSNEYCAGIMKYYDNGKCSCPMRKISASAKLDTSRISISCKSGIGK
jgi:hypothetical protein